MLNAQTTDGSCAICGHSGRRYEDGQGDALCVSCTSVGRLFNLLETALTPKPPMPHGTAPCLDCGTATGWPDGLCNPCHLAAKARADADDNARLEHEEAATKGGEHSWED